MFRLPLRYCWFGVDAMVLRFVFHTAAAWAEETAVYGMIFAVYLGATMAVRDRAISASLCLSIDFPDFSRSPLLY